tara:strand:+ start:5226 stop:5603 length:378 start_codon:yes stop_codon:yes gene_type:complete
MINRILQAGVGEGTSDIMTILITIIGTVGAGGAVKLVQLILQYRKEMKAAETAPLDEYRESLKLRIESLEELVVTLRLHIEELIKMYSEKILVLSTENATLVAKLEAALEDLALLREELKNLTKK